MTSQSVETNIFEAKIPDKLNVGSLEIGMPSVPNASESGQFFKELFRTIKSRTTAFYSTGTVYFLGDSEQLVEDLEDLQARYSGLQIGKQTQRQLQLSNPRDLGIVRNLLYLRFESLIFGHGYAVRSRKSRDKVAIPSFEQLHTNQGAQKLVELTGYNPTVSMVESFFYRLNLKPNGTVNLTIDPKLQVLIPISGVGATELSKAYLSTICFADSDSHNRCQLLRDSSVKFVGTSPRPASLPSTKCAMSARSYSLVFDPKRNEQVVLPNGLLYLEGHPASLGIFDIVRKRALKLSKFRRDMTLAFASHLANDSSVIHVPFGEEVGIEFPAKPKVLPMTTISPTDSLDYATFLGEPLLTVMSSPMYARPMDALNSDGPYSRNNNGGNIFHPNPIILHVIYPRKSKTLVDGLLSPMSNGTIGFAGFSANHFPFYSDVKTLEYPIEPALLEYKSTISTIKDKIDGKGHVILAVLPDDMVGYWDLKALCLQHNIASQFVKEKTILATQKALQYFLWNIAIAIYAKAGGTPWKVDSSLLKFSECYVGIQTKTEGSRYATKSFFVGAADIFNSMGEFITCAAHQGNSATVDGLHVDRDFMKNLILSTLSRYRATVKVYPSSIIVHRQVNFDDEETEGLLDGLKEAGINCRCILVHLQEGHHFRGYSTEPGDLTIERSVYYPLSRHSVVLFSTGKALGRYEGNMGTPKPTQVNIKVVNSETDVSIEDVESVCRGVLGFTRLHWNTTRIGVRSPLTLFAADQIGELAKNGFTGFQYRDIRDFL